MEKPTKAGARKLAALRGATAADFRPTFLTKEDKLEAMNVGRFSLTSVAWLVGVGAMAGAACSSDLSTTSGDGPDASVLDDAGAGASTPDGLPCDVAKVLQSRCGTCHGANPQYGAPQPLVTYDDLHAKSSGKFQYELVGERIHDDRYPMPPAPTPRLSTEETKVLDDWIANGAPRATATCEDDPSKDAGGGTVEPSPLGCTPDLQIRSKTKYTMPKKTVDQYVCVGVDVDSASKRHVTAFAAHVDNKTILHHVLLFQAPSSVSSTPTPCASFGSVSWQLIAGWAPGADPFELPPEAGFPQEKGTTHWVVQLHYNNAQGLEGQTDQSGFDLCTTDALRPNDAGLIGFGGTKFSIPPRSKKTVTCDYQLPAAFPGVTLLRAWPHMHILGTGLKSERIAGGKSDTIVDDPNFSFQSQLSHPVAMKLSANDLVRTSCTWNNATDKTVGFGERTGDEMCFNFLTYYPSLATTPMPGVPAVNWIAPAEGADCR